MLKVGTGLGAVFLIAIWIAGIVGWLLNVVKIVGLWGAPVSSELIIRIIGIPVFFIGGITGWF